MSAVSRPVRSVREQIVDQLRNDVLSQQIAADSPLRETELAQRFGVSRGPIRDALLQLTHEGALVYHPNRGVRVGSPAADDIRGLLVTLRREIERSALEQVFDDLDQSDHDQWQTMLDRLRHACEREDMPAVVEADMDFHRSLVQRAGSPDLDAIWLPITVRMRLMYSRHTRLTEVHNEHKRIVDAIVAGDRSRAAGLLESHIV